MLNKPAFTNNYCHKCRQTHKHEEKDNSLQCQKCGTLATQTKQTYRLKPSKQGINNPLIQDIFWILTLTFVINSV